jgi:hypothetical protein
MQYDKVDPVAEVNLNNILKLVDKNQERWEHLVSHHAPIKARNPILSFTNSLDRSWNGDMLPES